MRNCMIDNKENDKFDLDVKGLMNFSQSPTFVEFDIYFKTCWNPCILLKEIKSQTLLEVKGLKDVFISAYINSDATNDMYLFTVI